MHCSTAAQALPSRCAARSLTAAQPAARAHGAGLDDEPSSLVSQLAAQGVIENAFSLCFDTGGEHLLVLGHVRDEGGQLLDATVGGVARCAACQLPARLAHRRLPACLPACEALMAR